MRERYTPILNLSLYYLGSSMLQRMFVVLLPDSFTFTYIVCTSVRSLLLFFCFRFGWCESRLRLLVLSLEQVNPVLKRIVES